MGRVGRAGPGPAWAWRRKLPVASRRSAGSSFKLGGPVQFGLVPVLHGEES